MMTVHEIHKILPFLDIDIIQEAIQHLIMDFEVTQLFVATKVKTPEIYEQTIRLDSVKKVRNQSPLREQYKDLTEIQDTPLRSVKP
jgi:hypothetical protein